MDSPRPLTPAVATAAGFRIQSRVIDFITAERSQLLNVTERINEIVRRSSVADGLVHLQYYTPRPGSRWANGRTHCSKTLKTSFARLSIARPTTSTTTRSFQIASVRTPTRT